MNNELGIKNNCRMKKPFERGGFSLVEAIVAVSILILTLVSPITLAHRGLVSAEYSKDQMTAYNLAEQAVDHIHYLRHSNALKGNASL